MVRTASYSPTQPTTTKHSHTCVASRYTGSLECMYAYMHSSEQRAVGSAPRPGCLQVKPEELPNPAKRVKKRRWGGGGGRGSSGGRGGRGGRGGGRDGALTIDWDPDAEVGGARLW